MNDLAKLIEENSFSSLVLTQLITSFRFELENITKSTKICIGMSRRKTHRNIIFRAGRTLISFLFPRVQQI